MLRVCIVRDVCTCIWKIMSTKLRRYWTKLSTEDDIIQVCTFRGNLAVSCVECVLLVLLYDDKYCSNANGKTGRPCSRRVAIHLAKHACLNEHRSSLTVPFQKPVPANSCAEPPRGFVSDEWAGCAWLSVLRHPPARTTHRGRNGANRHVATDDPRRSREVKAEGRTSGRHVDTWTHDTWIFGRSSGECMIFFFRKIGKKKINVIDLRIFQNQVSKCPSVQVTSG